MVEEDKERLSDEELVEAIGKHVDALITGRLLKFHDGLVERGQIKPIPPKEEWPNHQQG